ncbi:hypothetical protein K438DRAFT_1218761 [Mycena galopus ATCC 62051]|nr:hypothetical protein K438DRAFT_1218761 [Mycena galopus ATCC 62051]
MPPKQMPKHPAADSPFSVLFEQNRVPSPEETKTIQELLVEKTNHLAHLNSQVPKRRRGKKLKISRELRTDLEYTRRFIKLHRALISPWRRLPVEILSDIFLLTLEARNIDEDDVWMDDREGTLLLCQICSAWRAVALRTPALWNTLSIYASDLFCPLDWVSTWLDRSRSSPVSLQLLWDSLLVFPDVLNSVMSIFASHLHHTAELAIDGVQVFGLKIFDEHDEEYPKLTFRPLVEPLNAPLLSTVIAHLPQGSLRDWIHAACRASPCLTHLTTSHSSLDSFPIDNLTELNWFHPAPMSRVLQIFEHAQNLKQVDFHIDGPGVISSAKAFLGMKSISKMELCSYDHLGQFLEQAEFPSLVDLRVCFIDAWPGPELHSFLSRSSCALTTLDFSNCLISQKKIITCLRHRACNSLESLSVQECSPPAANTLLQHLMFYGPSVHSATPASEPLSCKTSVQRTVFSLLWSSRVFSQPCLWVSLHQLD